VVEEKISTYLVVGFVFLANFLLMLLFTYLFSGGTIQFETYLSSLVYAVICGLLSIAIVKRRSVKKILPGIRIPILWAILLSGILVNSILNRPGLSIFDFALLALVCFWAGIIIVELDSIIFSCLIAFGLCVVIMFLELSLPAFLGVLSYARLNDIVYYQATRMIFLAVFPFPLILGVASSILGGYFGEKIFASA